MPAARPAAASALLARPEMPTTGIALAGRASARVRRVHNRLDLDAEREPAAAAGRARNRKIAAHGARDALDKGKPEAGAAIAACNLFICLRKRPEQALDLGGFEPDAAVGDGE